MESCHLPPMRRVREPAGSSSKMFCRPVVPSGKAKVRSLTETFGEGGLAVIMMLVLSPSLEVRPVKSCV